MLKINFYLLLSAKVLFFTSFIILLLALIKSDSILSKLVILEVLANVLIAVIALWAYQNNITMALDICIPIALIMFLSNVAYCYFLSVRESAHD